MKRFFQTTIAVVALALSACNINDDYDLSNIDGGDFALGDETSTFSIPLATVSVDINTLFNSPTSYNGSDLVVIASRNENEGDEVDESFDADEIVKLLNALLPSTMPKGYEDGIEFESIQNNAAGIAYVEPVIKALIDELKVSNSKRLILAETLLEDDGYSEIKTEILKDFGIDTEDLSSYTEQDIADDIYTYLATATDDEIDALVTSIAEEVVVQDFSLVTDPYVGEISEDDTKIDSSVIDMLTGTLDGSDFEIKIYYTIDTNLTFSFTLTVTLINTLTKDVYELGDSSDMQTINSDEELASLLENLKITYEVKTSTYSPSTGGLSGKYFNLKLMAKKKGALIL